jgi:hypothetical protein
MLVGPGQINSKMVTFSPSKIANIFQLNTHKSTLPLVTLIDEKFTDNSNIALIQEPPTKDGRLIGVHPPPFIKLAKDT